jgi:hypothetical protein
LVKNRESQMTVSDKPSGLAATQSLAAHGPSTLAPRWRSIHPQACHQLSLITACALAGLSGAALSAAPKERCVEKSGEASGITRGFAEYEAALIIRQVTGNWPIQTDNISEPQTKCRQGTVLWTCVARAKVCRRP